MFETGICLSQQYLHEYSWGALKKELPITLFSWFFFLDTSYFFIWRRKISPSESWENFPHLFQKSNLEDSGIISNTVDVTFFLFYLMYFYWFKYSITKTNLGEKDVELSIIINLSVTIYIPATISISIFWCIATSRLFSEDSPVSTAKCSCDLFYHCWREKNT